MADDPRVALVTVTGDLAGPPSWAVQQAVEAAKMSPCQKAKVGIAVYACERRLGDGQELVHETKAAGHNGPPWWPTWSIDELESSGPMSPRARPLCDGSVACRRDCSRRCVHAEARALDAILPVLFHRSRLLRLVHARLDSSGVLAACDGPSCGECSKMILDRGIGGIWLYERALVPDTTPELVGSGVMVESACWRYYPALEFHDATCQRLRIYQVNP